MLKEAFQQFGAVKRAQVMMARAHHNHAQDGRPQAATRSLHHGIVEFARYSDASQVLMAVTQDMFVMQFASRPLRVQPYATGSLSRWSAKSPADSVQAQDTLDDIRLIDEDAEDVGHYVHMRQIQQQHRAEVQILRSFHHTERQKTELEQMETLRINKERLESLKQAADMAGQVRGKGDEWTTTRMDQAPVDWTPPVAPHYPSLHPPGARRFQGSGTAGHGR